MLLKEASLDWHVLPIEATSAGGANLTKQPDGSVLASGKSPDADTYTITATTKLKGLTAFRLEALADPTMADGGPGRISNFVLNEIEVFWQVPGDAKPRRAELNRALASWEQTTTSGLDGLPRFTAANTIDGNEGTIWAIWPKKGQSHWLIVKPAQPIDGAEQTTLTFVIRQNGSPQHTLGRLRLSATTHASPLLAELWRPILVHADINAWTKLAAGHYLAGDDQAAIRALGKSPTAKGAYDSLLRAFIHSRLGQHEPALTGLLEGLQVLRESGADEPLRRLALEAIDRVHGESPDAVPVLAPAGGAAGPPRAARSRRCRRMPSWPSSSRRTLSGASARPSSNPSRSPSGTSTLMPKAGRRSDCKAASAESVLRLEKTGNDPRIRSRRRGATRL